MRARFYTTATKPSCGWVYDHDVVLAVGEYGVEIGELVTAKDVLGYFEKPWHWETLHTLWEASDE